MMLTMYSLNFSKQSKLHLQNMYRFLFVLLCFLCACKKEQLVKEEVHGIVLHKITKQPIANQVVVLNVTEERLIKTKDPEWPDGKLDYVRHTYRTFTNKEGKFSFAFNIDGMWLFYVSLINGEYTLKEPKRMGAFFDEAMIPILRNTYDTLLVEKPGYIRYTIKNIGSSHENDTLLVHTPYSNFSIGPDKWHSYYNWIFFGKVDKEIMDTVPAETEKDLKVQWLYKLTDTITYKEDNVQVEPGQVKDYIINY
jgi:hypothetical protein